MARLLDSAAAARARAAALRSRPDETGQENAIRAAFARVWETFHELRGYRQAFLMLVAFLLYNDGIQTIIRMASIYGAEIGIDRNAQIAAFVMVQFVGVPCSFLFGALAGRIGAKRAIFCRARRLHRHQHARLLHDDGVALLRAGVPRGHGAGRQPGAQPVALRADDPAAQVVGVLRLLLVFEKFAGIVGPALFAVSVYAVRIRAGAVLSVIIFFILGGLVLTRVDVAEGEAQARLGG